jgi:hypothetical protein
MSITQAPKIFLRHFPEPIFFGLCFSVFEQPVFEKFSAKNFLKGLFDVSRETCLER